MINIFLFLAGAFIAIFLLGRLIEKAKVPWIFAALLIGTLFSINNPFQDITNSETFTFLATLGMYFLLFMIGFEMNVKELRKRTGFIVKATFFIILIETLFGTLLIHYVFNYPWIISIIVSMSFATVGEAILIPILDEFKIINTKLGQLIIGVGTFDDIIEIILLISVGFLLGSQVGNSLQYSHIGIIIVSLFLIFALTFGFTYLKKRGKRFSFHSVESIFLVVLAVLFLFLGIGNFAEAAPLAALLAGIAVRTFIPPERLELIEREIKAVSYGFFAPLFFLWVGLSLDMKYLVTFPLLVLLVIAVSSGAKLLGSYIISRKELGARQSVLMGIGLSARFSTSLVIIKLLFDKGTVGNDIYSVIIASSIVLNFVIPPLFSSLINKWKINNTK
ncbi:MAG: cation:proton antiporter [Nanoarchaeota archaeon]|nr:cation:proton antiporter [Nanoarchaeota archaeon]